MNELETAIPFDCRGETSDYGSDSGIPTLYLDSHNRGTKPKMVTETEYWQKYYNDPDTIYEWNNGILEEKAVSDKVTNSMYDWLNELVGHYLKTKPIGEKIILETGFRMPLSHKTTIRRPDFGVILNSNPVPYEANDNSYKGICNLCVEALSDSTIKNIERDTKTKFGEYEAAGVEEYYIIYSNGEPMEFYRLNKRGVYVPIKRVNGDVIKSQVLPGFQFRLEDLYMQPYPQEMAFNPVYQGFVLPYYQEAKKRADTESKLRHQAETLAKKEAQRADAEAQRAEAEAQRAEAAETQALEEKKARQVAEKARQAAEEKIKRLEAKLQAQNL